MGIIIDAFEVQWPRPCWMHPVKSITNDVLFYVYVLCDIDIFVRLRLLNRQTFSSKQYPRYWQENLT